MMVVTVAVAMFVMADAMAVRSLEHQSAHNVTARPRQATRMASLKWIGSGCKRRLTDSITIKQAMPPRTIAL